MSPFILGNLIFTRVKFLLFTVVRAVNSKGSSNNGSGCERISKHVP